MGDLVQVYVARDIPHAYLVKGALEEAGIASMVGNESLQSALGDLPAFVTAPTLLVDEADAPRALELLKEIDDAAREAREDD